MRMWGSILYLLLQNLIPYTASAIPITKNFEPVEEPSLEELCVERCSCGTFRHPFEAVVQGKALFVTFPSSNALGDTESLGKLSSFVQPTLNLLYPVNVFFCKALEIERMPKFVGPAVGSEDPVEEEEEVFFSKLTVYIMRQGILKEVVRDDFYPFRSSLEYVDLSYNQITYIAPDALLDLVMLQEIDLRFNNLKQLGSPLWLSGKNVSPFVAVGSNRKFLTAMRLRGNPITCSCGLARTLILHVIIPIDDGSTCTLNKSSTKSGLPTTTQFNIAQPSTQLQLSRLTCAMGRDGSNTHKEARSLFEGRPQHSQESKLTDSHRDLTKWVMRSLTPSQKHQIADAKLNISMPYGGTEERYEEHSNVVHRVYKNRGELDIPLLITMTAWFLMVYFGIVRFIKANSLDHYQHLTYLDKLDTPDKENSDTETDSIEKSEQKFQ